MFSAKTLHNSGPRCQIIEINVDASTPKHLNRSLLTLTWVLINPAIWGLGLRSLKHTHRTRKGTTMECSARACTRIRPWSPDMSSTQKAQYPLIEEYTLRVYRDWGLGSRVWGLGFKPSDARIPNMI